MKLSAPARELSAPSSAPHLRAYDPARLRRAASLAVQRLGPRQFVVAGQTHGEYHIDLDEDPCCYCADQEYRGMQCKHELAARLHSGAHPELIMALGEMLLSASKHQER